MSDCYFRYKMLQKKSATSIAAGKTRILIDERELEGLFLFLAFHLNHEDYLEFKIELDNYLVWDSIVDFIRGLGAGELDITEARGIGNFIYINDYDDANKRFSITFNNFAAPLKFRRSFRFSVKNIDSVNPYIVQAYYALLLTT